MAPLTRLAILVALAIATPVRANPVTRWQPYIVEASTRFGVPSDWIERLIRTESAGLDRLYGRPIRSPKGAMGLMQLMPQTWAELRAALRLGHDPDNPRDNIIAGTFYLRRMYDRFGYPGCFAAYNAGPSRYAAWLKGQQSLPRETMAYLRSVGAGVRPPAANIEPRSPALPPLFVVLRASVPTAAYTSPSFENGALFAIRKVAP